MEIDLYLRLILMPCHRVKVGIQESMLWWWWGKLMHVKLSLF